MRFVVLLTDEEQGYQDMDLFGPFATLTTAHAFAERLRARVKRDAVKVHVRAVARPLMRNVDDEWFEADYGGLTAERVE